MATGSVSPSSQVVVLILVNLICCFYKARASLCQTPVVRLNVGMNMDALLLHNSVFYIIVLPESF